LDRPDKRRVVYPPRRPLSMPCRNQSQIPSPAGPGTLGPLAKNLPRAKLNGPPGTPGQRSARAATPGDSRVGGRAITPYTFQPYVNSAGALLRQDGQVPRPCRFSGVASPRAFCPRAGTPLRRDCVLPAKEYHPRKCAVSGMAMTPPVSFGRPADVSSAETRNFLMGRAEHRVQIRNRPGICPREHSFCAGEQL
jgi:hypothetical protein